MLAVGVTTTTQPQPITTKQRIAICVLFKALGIHRRADRMRELSRHAQRPIGAFEHLTTAEAAHIEHTLRQEWTRAKQRLHL